MLLSPLRLPPTNVSAGNPAGSPPYASWHTAAPDIQTAVDAATNGDIILVTNGVYHSGGRVVFGTLTNRVAISKSLTVQSVNGPSATVIQGNPILGPAAVRCVYMTSNSVLSGFTLTNGATLQSGDLYQEESGGALWATNATDAIVTNCVLAGSSASQFGGGAYGGNIVNSVIAQNTAYDGGGLAAAAATNSLIVSNTASGYGGGVWSATLKNCEVLDNTAPFGGGAESSSLYGCLVAGNQAYQSGGGMDGGKYLVYCTVVGNSSEQGGGGINGGFASIIGDIIYFNSVFYGSSSNYEAGGSISSCCTWPMPPSGSGSGNLTNDPGFVNYASGNFQLQSNSPCINSGGYSHGYLAADLAGDPRVVDGFVDIGAYEYQSAHFILPWLFAQTYGLSLDGSIDSDGDGMNNWQEAYCGTNPTNSALLLKIISVTPSTAGAFVEWQSVPGHKYFVQHATSLAAYPAFTTILTNITAFQTTSSTIDPATTTNSGPYFYRVAMP